MDTTSKTLLEAVRKGKNEVPPRPNVRAHGSVIDSHFLDAVQEQATEHNHDVVVEQTAGKSNRLHGQDGRERHEIPSNSLVEATLLRGLLFPTLEARQEAVAEAHGKTFQWVLEESTKFQSPWDNFVQWLRGKSNIYWINGKAASGKSTLMKYICSHPKVRQALEVWSDQSLLVTATYFFWNTGMPLQKSQDGLLRSLLYQILSKCPHLIEYVLPELWAKLKNQKPKVVSKLRESWHSWSSSHLKQAFKRLMDQCTHSLKICLFIDGLDEFDGDHGDIIAFFKRVSTATNIKLCLSSRPLLIFEQEYGAFSKLRLQDLTRNDIKTYAYDKLHDNPRIRSLSQTQPDLLTQLVLEILEMSSGVFLWVTLAIRSLLRGLTNLDSIGELQHLLRALPPELDDLFSLMLRSIQPALYVVQASKLFQIMYQSRPGLTALALSYANDEHVILPISTPVGPISSFEARERVLDIGNRVKSRCAGLLEVEDSPPNR